jgi:hypothetical protein
VVAGGERGGDEPVSVGGNDGIPADGQGELGDDQFTQRGDVFRLDGQGDAGAWVIRGDGGIHDGGPP